MLSGRCLKIAVTFRVPLYKRVSVNKTYLSLPWLCQCYNMDTSRLFFSTAQVNYVRKTVSQNKRYSPNSFNTETPNTAENKIPEMSNENLLERLITNLSTDIHQKNRVYKNDFLKIVNKIKELNFSTKKQGLLLLRCCTELLPDETPTGRMELAEQVWCTIKPHTTFEVEHYNELLRVYIANNRSLTVSTFIQKMSPVKPDNTTYELILKTLAEAGDLNQSTEVISNMKAQGLPATESIFNSLIICESKAGNLNKIQEVLTMMKSLKFDPSADTYTSIARALAFHKKHNLLLDELEKAQKSGVKFEEKHIMEIVKTLAAMSTYTPISQVLRFLPDETLKSPSISPYMQSVATHLVFQNHPITALEIYKCLPLPSFGPKDDPGLHGRSLVRDSVKASVPSSVIALITQELMSTGRNPIAIHNAAEAALQLGKIPLVQDIFTRMQHLGIPIRPHYFWPILLHASKSYGERGIMNTLQLMLKMDVKPDYETIMEYTLPYVSFTSPQNLMKKFLEAGLSVTMVLTPMMETLLNTGQVRAASEICELFKGKVDADKLIKPLLKGYFTSSDVKSTVHILEDITNKASEKNKDWVGRFLCNFMKHKKARENLTDFLSLVKAIKGTEIKISTPAVDLCMNLLPQKYSDKIANDFKDHLIEITDERLVDEGDMFSHQIPHPKQMDEANLKAHLNELEAKNMNTRGVLRKLLQQYCREGNLKAAREIADRCQKEGVFLSAGMKASIFDLHVKLGELDLAEIALADLNKTAPNFTLDEHKIIDFATLMVYRKKIDKAIEMISEQSKKRHVIGGRNTAMNCWRLLDVTASTFTPVETQRMFDLLISLRYCNPSNAILGPLIRVHLRNDDLESLQNAIKTFVKLSDKYKKTPLKHEFLCKILMVMGDGGNEEMFVIKEKLNGTLNKMVQTILNVDKKVHGSSDVQLTLVAALAEVGYKKTLRKILLDPTVKLHPDALLRRCERFADEKKVSALECLAECARDLRHIYVDELYEMILDIYQRQDNYKQALLLWQRMQEIDITPSKKFITNICSLLKMNHVTVPNELTILLDKQAKVSSG